MSLKDKGHFNVIVCDRDAWLKLTEFYIADAVQS